MNPQIKEFSVLAKEMLEQGEYDKFAIVYESFYKRYGYKPTDDCCRMLADVIEQLTFIKDLFKDEDSWKSWLLNFDKFTPQNNLFEFVRSKSQLHVKEIVDAVVTVAQSYLKQSRR